MLQAKTKYATPGHEEDGRIFVRMDPQAEPFIAHAHKTCMELLSSTPISMPINISSQNIDVRLVTVVAVSQLGRAAHHYAQGPDIPFQNPSP